MSHSLTLTTACVLSFSVAMSCVIMNTNTVLIKDGDDLITRFTMERSPDQILVDANVAVGQFDQVAFSGWDKRAGTIEVERAFPVCVNADGKQAVLMMTGGNVSDALKKAGVTMDTDDEINCEESKPLCFGMSINVDRVEYAVVEVKESIAYSKEEKESSKLFEGDSKIVKGKKGLKVISYLTKIVNGEQVSSNLIGEQVKREPKNEVKLLGVKEIPVTTTTTTQAPVTTTRAYVPPPPPPVAGNGDMISPVTPSKPLEFDENGVPSGYSSVTSGQASAYSANAGARTAAGYPAQVGYIAVDPNQFPYGTELYIVSADGQYNYGYCIAADTGGFAGGARTADLFFNTVAECMSFGVREIIIYVL